MTELDSQYSTDVEFGTIEDDLAIINFENLCRICGTFNENLISIFNEEGTGLELKYKLKLHLNITAEKCDILPQQICENCLTTLLNFHHLYTCCIDTKAQFAKMLKSKIDEEQTTQNDNKENYNVHLNQSKNCEETNTNNLDILNGSILHQQLERTKRIKRKCEPIISKKRRKKCQFCTNQFPSKFKLIEHLKNRHSELIFGCDVCSDYFSRDILTEHMAAHVQHIEETSKMLKPKIPPINKPIKCIHCDKAFANKNSRRYHIQVVHQNIRNYKCSECEQCFGLKRTLLNHVRSRHENSKTFACEICSKSFTTDSGLFAHKRIHENLFYFSCDICYKHFKFQSHLTRHKTIHSNKKTFFCTICKKGFNNKGNLTVHIKVHSDATSKCHICSFITTQRRYLGAHMKRVHNTVISQK